MEKDNKYYSLIESLVRKHKKFPGYEEILDDIIDDVYSHSEVIINSINNESVINAYLEKVISTSIITVPKRLNFYPKSRAVKNELVDKMINASFRQESKAAESPVEDDLSVLDDIAVEESVDIPVQEDSAGSVYTLSLEEDEPEDVLINQEESVESFKEESILSEESSGFIEEEAESLPEESSVYEAEEQPEEVSSDVNESLFGEPETEPEVKEQPEINADDAVSLLDDSPEEVTFGETVSLIDEPDEALIEEEISLPEADTSDVILSEEQDILAVELPEENERIEETAVSEEILENEDNSLIEENETAAPDEALIADDTVFAEEGNSDFQLEEFAQEPDMSEINEAEEVSLSEQDNLAVDESVSDDAEVSFDLVPEFSETAEIEQPEEFDSELPSEELLESSSNDLFLAEDTLSLDLQEEEPAVVLEEDAKAPECDFAPTDYSKFNILSSNNEEDISYDAEEIVEEILNLNNKRPELNISKVYELKYKENQSVPQIANQLEMSEGSVIEALCEIVALV